MSEEYGQQRRRISSKREPLKKGDSAPKKKIIGKISHLSERRKASIVSGGPNWRHLRDRANLKKRKW